MCEKGGKGKGGTGSDMEETGESIAEGQEHEWKYASSGNGK